MSKAVCECRAQPGVQLAADSAAGVDAVAAVAVAAGAVLAGAVDAAFA